jgi:hypothetical protein
MRLRKVPLNQALRGLFGGYTAVALVTVRGLGRFRTMRQFGGVSNHDRIAEINDMIDVLQGGSSALARCRDALAGTSTFTPRVLGVPRRFSIAPPSRTRLERQPSRPTRKLRHPPLEP